ncbi:MAG: PorP/SprF family type IX secretion system membrane protein [Bacteroidales bacterium]|nr:PorP/SprF family type IX secretion system membrane protein [Bacteroidales bacterium]MCF8328150.1 PorP/SprF family type IX secretion system membrane protein [Bacteroidales bacterium]
MKQLHFLALLLFILSNFSNDVKSQDANFTQFFNNPVYFNPATAGIENGMNIRTAYRKLWPSIGNGFNSYMVSVDIAEPAVNGGLGLIIQSGNEGVRNIRENSIGAMYSYRLPVIRRKFYIQMGLQASAVSKHIKQNGYVFSDQLDPIYGDIYTSGYHGVNHERVFYPDFNAGIAGKFNVGKFNNGKARTTHVIGFSAAHITRPDESFIATASARRPVKFVAHYNSVIPLRWGYMNKKKVSLAPGVVYENQAMFETLSMGLNFMLDPVYLGIWSRSRTVIKTGDNYNAAVVMGGVKTSVSQDIELNVGYSYDITISKLAKATTGAHEISVSFAFDTRTLFPSQKRSLKDKIQGTTNCYNMLF